MRTLVTGARGRLGAEVAAILERRGHAVLGHRGRSQFDLADAGQTDPFVRAFRPTAVVHCAARTDLESCQADPAGAARDNGDATRLLLDAAPGAYFLYVSTAHVFDGAKGRPYDEQDRPHPLSVYAQTKRAGEELVEQSAGRWAIVRSDWLYGVRGASFPKLMLTEAAAGEVPRLVEDEFGSPTAVADLAEAICDLVEEREPGVFHLTNAGVCSPVQWAEAIFRLAGVTSAIERVPLAQLQDELRRAPRPPYHGLCSRNWEPTGHAPLRPWEAALADYLDRALNGEPRSAAGSTAARSRA